ncbi:MAG TPA: hypothetical protein VK116_17835, partial [Planctomycetota bacterium]|nr:hypothetical protein [Planctomycetota bacterium]
MRVEARDRARLGRLPRGREATRRIPHGSGFAACGLVVAGEEHDAAGCRRTPQDDEISSEARLDRRELEGGTSRGATTRASSVLFARFRGSESVVEKHLRDVPDLDADDGLA